MKIESYIITFNQTFAYFNQISSSSEHVTVSFARSGGPGGQNVNKGFSEHFNYFFCNKLEQDFIDLSFAVTDMQQNKRHKTMKMV